MIRAFLLSIGQMGDPAILKVFLKSLALTLAILAVLGAGLWWAAGQLTAWAGASGTWQQIAGAAAVLGAVALAWLIFRVVAILVIGIFGDDVVLAVERRHYPEALLEARDVPVARSIGMGLGSAGRTVLINLFLSPVYLVLIVTGVGTVVLFFIVNGWLLGRDLGDMVAARHMPRGDLKGWRGSTSVSRFTLGLIGTGLFVVPVLQLLAPVLSVAMATHWFHRDFNARRQA